MSGQTWSWLGYSLAHILAWRWYAYLLLMGLSTKAIWNVRRRQQGRLEDHIAQWRGAFDPSFHIRG